MDKIEIGGVPFPTFAAPELCKRLGSKKQLRLLLRRQSARTRYR
jgi:hypothetical protein